MNSLLTSNTDSTTHQAKYILFLEANIASLKKQIDTYKEQVKTFELLVKAKDAQILVLVKNSADMVELLKPSSLLY